jgi:hypothetical protein
VRDFLDRRLRPAAGGVLTRIKKSYDPGKFPDEVRKRVALNQVPDRQRGTVERLIRDVCRLQDVRTQLFLHRTLKQWLVLHLACAAALGVFLLVHIVTMLRVIL